MIVTRKTKISLVWALALLVAACAPTEAELTPTVEPNAIRTEAVSTFASSLTGTALAKPTATITATPVPTITPVTLSTLTTSTVAAGVGVGTSCNNLVYVADVTVPDNTSMTPGQAFTKTWRVQNTGTCAWAPGYRFSLVGGEAMGGQALTLSQPVAINATTELSVPLTAPTNRTGTLQATWRMSDDKGVFFGDALTVVIVVGGTAPTNTGAAAVTTPTTTATPITPTP